MTSYRSLLEYARRAGIEHDAGEALDLVRGGCEQRG
jgi:hypothetical protein